jgi:hypothetical protein
MPGRLDASRGPLPRTALGLRPPAFSLGRAASACSRVNGRAVLCLDRLRDLARNRRQASYARTTSSMSSPAAIVLSRVTAWSNRSQSSCGPRRPVPGRSSYGGSLALRAGGHSKPAAAAARQTRAASLAPCASEARRSAKPSERHDRRRGALPQRSPRRRRGPLRPHSASPRQRSRMFC